MERPMEHKYWLAHPDFDYCDVFRKPPLQIEEVWAFAQTGHVPKLDLRWNPDRENALRPDFPIGAHGLLMSPRAAELLLPWLGEWALHAEVSLEGAGFTIAIPTAIYDAMDETSSVGDQILPSGHWFSVEKLVLIKERIGPSPFFRLPNRGINKRMILADEIVDTAMSAGLTGLVFREVAVR